MLPSVGNESGFSAVQTNARAVLANRPLGILALANLLTLAAFNTKLIVQVFYAQYVIGDVSMIAYMSFISIGCIYLGGIAGSLCRAPFWQTACLSGRYWRVDMR